MMNNELNQLETAWAGNTCLCFDILDSTQEYAKSLAKKEKVHGTLICAEEQTAGKGLHVYKTSLNTGDIIGVALVSDNDNILLVGTPNSICISAKDVPEYSRISMGNMMVKGSKITSVVKL